MNLRAYMRVGAVSFRSLKMVQRALSYIFHMHDEGLHDAQL